MYRQLELDEKVFDRCNDILVKTLQDEKQKHLTRNAINEAIFLLPIYDEFLIGYQRQESDYGI